MKGSKSSTLLEGIKDSMDIYLLNTSKSMIKSSRVAQN